MVDIPAGIMTGHMNTSLKVTACASLLGVVCTASTDGSTAEPSQEMTKSGKRKVHPCTGTEALYRPFGP